MLRDCEHTLRMAHCVPLYEAVERQLFPAMFPHLHPQYCTQGVAEAGAHHAPQGKGVQPANGFSSGF